MADHPHIPMLTLERYALGELAPAERQELEQRLARDPGVQRQLDALGRENAHILATYPPQLTVPAIERRLRMQRAAAQLRRPAVRWPLLAPLGGALAAAGLALVLLQPGASPQQSADQPEVTRIKGLRAQLLIFAKPAAGAELHTLADGDAVQAHELVQVGYVAAGKQHGVVVSIDGRGETTLHFPAAPELTTRLGAGQVLLPSAYELDDAPRFERFFLVTSARPISTAAVLAAARKLASDEGKASTARLALPPDLEQTSLLLLKYNKNHKEGTAP